jgi:hypothetical protein
MLDIGSLVASVEAFTSATAQADRAQLLAQMRDQLEKLRAADEKSRSELEALCEGAAKGEVGAVEGLQAVLASRENESAAAKTLREGVLSLQRYLIDTSRLDDPEAHQLVEKAVNIVVGYFAGYQNLRDQAIVLAVASGGMLRAHPVEGEIDHAELTRQIIARFPKILAELAK